MSGPSERDLVELWLQAKGCTLWGRAFNVNEDPSAAAAWFLREMHSFIDFDDAFNTVTDQFKEQVTNTALKALYGASTTALPKDLVPAGSNRFA